MRDCMPLAAEIEMLSIMFVSGGDECSPRAELKSGDKFFKLLGIGSISSMRAVARIGKMMAFSG